MTGSQDRGELHEDRAAEGVSRTRACLPPELQLLGAAVDGC